MLIPIVENTIEISPKQLREIADAFESQIGIHPTGCFFVNFEDKWIFKYDALAGSRDNEQLSRLNP